MIYITQEFYDQHYLIIKITVFKSNCKKINYLLLKVSRLLNESNFSTHYYYPNHSFKSHSLIVKKIYIIIKISAVYIEIFSQTKYLIDFLQFTKETFYFYYFVKLFAITWLLFFLLCCSHKIHTVSSFYSFVFFFGNKWISYFLKL